MGKWLRSGAVRFAQLAFLLAVMGSFITAIVAVVLPFLD